MILLFNEDSQAEKKVEHVLHSPPAPVSLLLLYTHMFFQNNHPNKTRAPKCKILSETAVIFTSVS